MRSTFETETPLGIELLITEDELTVTLQDGRRISVPIAWFPTLLHASEAERKHYEWIADGIGIHWPDLDEDLSIAGFLAGVRSRPRERTVTS